MIFTICNLTCNIHMGPGWVVSVLDTAVGGRVVSDFTDRCSLNTGTLLINHAASVRIHVLMSPLYVNYMNTYFRGAYIMTSNDYGVTIVLLCIWSSSSSNGCAVEVCEFMNTFISQFITDGTGTTRSPAFSCAASWWPIILIHIGSQVKTRKSQNYKF